MKPLSALLRQSLLVSIGMRALASAFAATRKLHPTNGIRTSKSGVCWKTRFAEIFNEVVGMLRGSDAQPSPAIYDHALRHMAEVKKISCVRRCEVSALAGSSHSLLSLSRAMGGNATF
jgi:hypothetical protein